MTHSMLAPTSLADGHGPQWAAAVADLVDRAGAAFDPAVQGCLTVLDLEPWRRADAWWLRNRLEPLVHAKVSQRAVRYVPCVGPGPKPPEAQAQALADAWSAGAPPVTLDWPAHKAAPHCAHSGHAWVPDGPVLILAGELAQRLPQDLMLAHHGEIKLWAGEPGAQAWQAVDATRHSPWVTQSVLGYAQGLPSAMFSLPLGYWRFLEKAVAWAAHGVLVLSRAPGWSSLADFREDAATRADVSAEMPPVNFHWLAQQAPRLGASAHAVHACRSDAVQLLGAGLDSGNSMLALLADPLRSALQSPRADRARAVRMLANQGDLSAALAVLESSGHDPALLRAAWDALAPIAAAATPAVSAQLGTWLDRVTANIPWMVDDAELLRAAGHLALACARLDLAQNALAALQAEGMAVAGDLAAHARCEEQLGRLDAALDTCSQALLLYPGHEGAQLTRSRCAVRKATLSAPWRLQQGHSHSPLMLDPLHADHAPMLFRQMRDPSIAFMTALPTFTEGDDGRAWIEARLADGAMAFAIVHWQHGLIGYLDLRVWRDTAFICYWIGADYQGLGYCAPAIALGLDMAWRNGIELVLSSAYEDNVRSLRSLHKSGFRPMTLRATAPDSDRRFVMLPAAGHDGADAPQRLIDFCANTGSGLCFDATPEQEAHEAPETGAAFSTGMTQAETHGMAPAGAPAH